MNIPGYSTILLQIDEGIGRLELNTPPSNTMTMKFFTEFSSVLEFISNSQEFKALVITGHGRHYSSGADVPVLLKEILEKTKTDEHGRLTVVPDFLSNNYRSLLMLESFSIPIISAIRGVCLGSALELALFSHFRLCGEDAVFGLPEASFNLVPGLGGIYKLACISGEALALERVLKGSTFTAEDALKYKIIDKIVPKKALMPTAFNFAREVMQDFRVEKRGLYIKKYFS
ncbi:MAG: enoyl-CoA hydratase/isomerase family protein [Bacteroidetes bacterium]|nr:enoyl-CoA hydratase/isomerase family protein [Bacteroidota bacterium]